jgi:hypothetical protein
MGTLADHKALEDDTFLKAEASHFFSISYLSLRILRMLLHTDISSPQVRLKYSRSQSDEHLYA